MVDIDLLHKAINFPTDKGVTGYHKSNDIDREIHAASMDLWKKYYNEYARTQKIHDYLSPFEKKDTIIIDAGGLTATMNIAIEHPTLALMESGQKVDIIERAFWNSHINDPVAPPTTDLPIITFATRDANGIYTIDIQPSILVTEKLVIYGLAKPVKPLWGYTIGASGRRVYAATGGTNGDSVHLEWSETLFGDLRDRVLVKMGMNLREQQTVQEAIIERQQGE